MLTKILLKYLATTFFQKLEIILLEQVQYTLQLIIISLLSFPPQMPNLFHFHCQFLSLFEHNLKTMLLLEFQNVPPEAT